LSAQNSRMTPVGSIANSNRLEADIPFPTICLYTYRLIF